MALIDDARTAVRGGLCSVLNGLEAIDRFAVNLGLPENAPPSFPGTPFGNIVNNGQGLLCDRQPQPLPGPRTAGNCPALYRIDYAFTITNPSTGFTTPSTNFVENVVGPISSFKITSASSPQQITVVERDGPRLVRDFNSTSVISDLRDVVYTRSDGQADNCPPPPIVPLPEADRTRPITINNITGVVAFAFPTLNVNGDLQVGFTLEVGELELSGTVELNTGDINFNFGGQPTDPDAPEVPTPDGDVPDSPDDDPEEEKPANIIGVVVVSTELGNATATEVLFPNSPNVLVPRCATVQFKIRIKNKAHWTSEIPVRSRNAYIHCPGEIDAIGVVVTTDPGWVVAFTPVRGIIPSNQVVLI